MAQDNPTQRPQEQIHAVQHFEIVSTEPNQLRTFLESQFGWKFESHPLPQGGEYLMFRMPDGNGGGVTPPMDPSQPIAVTPYVNVADIHETLKRCEKAGAKILMPVTDVEGMGKFFWFQVAGGPPLACWQSASPA